MTRPARTLVAFRRVALAPGERQTLELLLWPEAMSLLDEELQPTIEPGEFRVIVGEELLSATFRVVPPAPRTGGAGRHAPFS
ncbi:MAG TPA: fibronectin type III-like domain-contianing protein [Anaeromyxobacter sp.]|nr:fibronectin type III-like domain-contianing protein [Anaeromyxobacter sp.]